MSTGRNEPCPCGSGKKFKKCCGSPTKETAAASDGLPENIVAAFYDAENDRAVMFKADMLLNQLRREGPRIAETFDGAFDDELKDISEQFSRVFALLMHGTKKAGERDQEGQYRCCLLMLNAGQTCIAALELVRHGFRLQPGILIRSAIESLCVVISLFTGQTSIEDYDEGKFHSPKAVSHAKKFLPVFGQAYGFFSRQFTHLGDLHKRLHSWGEFTADDEAANLNVSFVKIALHLLTITAEVVLYDYTNTHRFWKKIAAGQFTYEPSAEEQQWQKEFLG